MKIKKKKSQHNLNNLNNLFISQIAYFLAVACIWQFILIMGLHLDLIITTEDISKDINIQTQESPKQDKEALIQKLQELICRKTINNELIDITKITALTLSNCQLVTVPDSVGYLNLRTLNLSHNELNSVPPSLYIGLRPVQELDLSFNKIDSFFTEPECIKSLKKLNLSNNKFVNLPKWILSFRCLFLEDLDYSTNGAQHYKFKKNSYNRSICKIRRLILSNACMLDIDYDFLKCLKTLEHLDISNVGEKHTNNLSDLDLLFVKPQWISLKVLVLDNLNLVILPEGLMWLESLQELYVRHNYLSWIQESIQYLVNLEILDVSYNELGALSDKLFALPSLRIFKAPNNFINQQMNFENNLEWLDLYNNSMEQFDIDIVSLKFVDLELNYFDTRGSINDYEKKMSKLRSQCNEDRSCGPKQKTCVSTSDEDDTKEKTEYEEEFLQESNENSSDTYPDENWDEPSASVEKQTRTAGVTVSDDEWMGVTKCKSNLRDRANSRKYVDDEMWMFEDGFESN